MRSPSRLLLLLACFFPLLLVAPGCATQSLHRMPWLTLKTPNFEILSALDAEDTVQLARDLERFRIAVEFMLGARLPTEPVPMRVYAFDDRTIIRAFRVRNEPAYLLPSSRGNVLVLRAGDGFGDATLALRDELAHLFLRRVRGFDTPLWYEEGMAQLLAPTEVEGQKVKVGVLNQPAVLVARDHIWSSVDTVLEMRDLRGRGGLQRSEFEAECWVILHYLFFGRASPQRVQRTLAGVLESYARAPWEVTTARSLFDVSAAELDQNLRRYAESDRFGVIEVVASEAGETGIGEPTSLTFAQVTEQLGWLALALRRQGQAIDYFDLSLADDAGQAGSLVGLAVALAQQHDFDAAAARLQEGLARAPDVVATQLFAGDVERWWAAASVDEPGRRRHLQQARVHYERAHQLGKDQTGPLAGFAATHLVAGEDPEAALEMLEAARRLDPGSLDLALMLAEVHARIGQGAAARELGLAILSRTHTGSMRKAGEALVEWLRDQDPERAPWVVSASEEPWAR